LGAAALFGASTPASKLLLGRANPLLLSGLLYAGAALAVAPFALRDVAELRSIDRRSWLRLAGIVMCGGVVGPALLLFGLSMARAGSVALWLNLESVATAVLARAFFKEHLHAPTWFAVSLIVVGSALLSPTIPHGGVAMALVALACVAWGIDNNLTSLIDRFTPAQVIFAKGAVAGLLNTGLGVVAGGGALSSGTAMCALTVGGLGYGASLLLYVGAAQQLGATRSQLIFATAPAFGLTLAWAWLGEPMTPAQWSAAALMAGAIWIWHRERHQHSHTHAQMTHVHRHRHDDGHHEHAHPMDVDLQAWHSHEHSHEPQEHVHPHRPDLHHRHRH
jgi:drug/metabolite transporter (DMT)-like permease